MITRYIIGDITNTELKYIAHGVNCQDVMGSGVAKAIYTKFPVVKERYHSFCKFTKQAARLGSVSSVRVEDKIIFNCFTQLNYGYDGQRYVNYKAVANCFETIMGHEITGPIAIPKIGCGLAGGDWTFMEQLINDTVGGRLELWVYELETPKFSKRNDLA